MLQRREKSSDGTRAYGYAIRLLTSREYGYEELLKKLGEKYEDEAAEEAASLCRQQGYQSDERYAEMLCRHAALKLSGPNYLYFEAQRKGLEPALLEPYLEEIDFDNLALEFLRRRFSEKLAAADGAEPHELYKLKQRMLAALYRRGFDPDTCRRAVEQFSA